jgi:hypothetical protein
MDFSGCAKIGTLPASLILSRLLNGAIDVSLGRGLSKMVTNSVKTLGLPTVVED